MRRPAFALLRYFSIASLVALIAATVVLTALQQRLAERDLIQAQEHHHIVLTRSVAHGHWGEFSDFFRIASSLDAAAMQQHPEYIRLLKQVQQEFFGTQVLKIKIYDAQGRTVFSTDPSQLGEDKSNNAGFLSARNNVPASELTHRNQFSAFEQTVEDIDVVSSYVPLHRDNGKGGSSEVEAVFEIYSDISQLLAHVRETRNAVALRVTGVLLLLYLALFFIVRHADGVIKAQELQRQRDEESLRAAREEVLRSEQFHRALIEHSSDAVLLLGPDLKVSYVTPADVRVLGLPETGLIGLSLPAYACAEYRELIIGWLGQVVDSPEDPLRVEFEGNHAGDRRYFVATATNLRNHPAVQGIVVNIRDVTERKLAELQVRRHALYDDLTGLARREFFVQQTRKAIARAARRQEMLALMFLDLDGFKKINDALGHHVGDLLLKEVGTRLRDALRQEDTIGRLMLADTDDRIARFGGDEFTVLLSGLIKAENAAQVARRTLDAISVPYVLEGREIVVTISIGIAIYPQDGTDADELFKRADAAMYAAKSTGRNTYKFHSEPG